VVDQASASIADQVRIEGALATIRRNLIDVTQQDSTLHGWRVQALFEAVVASLGGVRLLKVEDSGDVFFSGDELKPPDFRIVDANGCQFLVDVKNAHQKRPWHSYRLRRKDGDEYRRYCDVVGVGSLKFALYWSKWNLWTLVSYDRFQNSSSSYLELPFVEAIKYNEMGIVGDPHASDRMADRLQVVHRS
jgi:hypothetical protein